jgi:type II secretory pathway pseudopilin PulG
MPSPASQPAVPSPRRRAEGGYNMVILIVAITVLNIVVAAMLPLMSTQIQREKEEELVFRGFQYAEAIRIYHARFQQYPVKLEQLLEAKPRSIRQLWKDPMTKDGKWGLIFQNQGVPLKPQPEGDPNGRQPGRQPRPVPREGTKPAAEVPPDDGGAEGNPEGGFNTPQKGDVAAIGPIIGVYSKSSGKSHLIFYGHEHYNEWRFTEDLLRVNAQPASVVPGIRDPGAGAPIPNFSTRWLGRPMPFADQGGQPQNGTLPDGSTPGGPNPNGGKGGNGRRPRGTTNGQPQT